MTDLTYNDCFDITEYAHALNKSGNKGNRFPGKLISIVNQNNGVVKNALQTFKETDEALMKRFCKTDKEGRIIRTKSENVLGQVNAKAVFLSDEDEINYYKERNELLHSSAGKFQLRKVSKDLANKIDELEFKPVDCMHVYYQFMIEEEKEQPKKVEEEETQD